MTPQRPLSDDLDELEATDPVVGDAADRLDELAGLDVLPRWMLRAERRKLAFAHLDGLPRQLADQVCISAAITEGDPRRADLKHASHYHLVMDLAGDPILGSQLPPDVPRDEAGMCYRNAAQLAETEGWTYVEGVAASERLGIAMFHAWCLDDDGRVVDPTWEEPEQCVYWGIPFAEDFVYELLRHYDLYGFFTADEMEGTMLRLGLVLDDDGRACALGEL